MTSYSRPWILPSLLAIAGLLLANCASAAPPPASTPTTSIVEPTAPAAAKPETKPVAPSPTPKPAADQPRYGGVLDTTLMADLASLDVHQENFLQAQATLQCAYSGILQYKPTDPDKIIADLAESWDVSPDGTVYTFRLQKGVTFHDGSPLTADDVKFSLERLYNPPKGIASQRAPTLAAIKSVEAPDTDTVKITLKFTQGSFLPMLAVGQVAIYPKKVVEAKGDMKKDVVGTGPFMFKDYSLGTLLEVRKNPNYFVKGLPYLDGIRFFVIKDESTKFSAFRTGRVKLIDPTMPAGLKPAQVQTIRREMPQANIVKYSSLSGTSVLMVVTGPPFSDVCVRRAVSLAVDRQAAVKILYEGEADTGTMFVPGSDWSLPEAEILKLPGYRQPKDADIAEARKLLADAGYEKGFKTRFMARARYTDDLAVLMKEQLARIGIELELVVLESAAFLDQLAKRSYPMAGYPVSVRTYDPDEMASFFHSKGSNRSGMVNEEVDALFDKQTQIVDLAERKKMIRELETKLLDLSPIVIMYWARGNVAHFPEVKNYTRGSIYSTNKYEGVWLAK